MDLYLGIDCGGTFIKAALFDKTGKIYALARQNMPVISPKAGYAQRNMADLWQSCASVIKQTIQQGNISPQQIKGVGISAQGKGAFLLDKFNQPLCGILSSDQRSVDIVKQWQQADLPQKLYPLTQQTLWTGHPVSILAWLKQYQPDRYQQIGTVLMSHDYLRFCLTGELHCEESNISESNLYNMVTGEYDPRLAEMLGLSDIMDKLPPIIGSSEIAGQVSKEAANLTGLVVGTPVVGGLFDVVASAICTGLDDEQKLNVVLGTWSVVSGVTSCLQNPSAYPFVYGRYAEKGKYLVHEASPTSAANLEWFIKQWGDLNYQQVNQKVASLPKGESSVFFIPFLYGSNAGLGMQAGFYGLQSYHCRDHLLQAIYEGVIFSLNVHLQRMQQRFTQANLLRVTGGATKSQVWLQMLADLTNMPIEVPQIEETGCLGAAIMAMLGDGVYANLSSAQGQMKQQLMTIKPDFKAFEKYQVKYEKYQSLVRYLSAFSEEISQK